MLGDDPASKDWWREMMANSREVQCPTCGQKERVFGKPEPNEDSKPCWTCERDMVGDE